MAIKVFCETKGCSQEGKITTEGKVSYIFKEGKLVPTKLPKCPDCGKDKSYQEEKFEGVAAFKIASFDGMSNEDKKNVLLKRMHADFKKDGEMQKEARFNKVVGNMQRKEE